MSTSHYRYGLPWPGSWPCAGLAVASAEPANVQTKGSRPFTAVTGDGRRLFIKALGSDQRDADLLYRAYRFARLRDVGDTWPAASAIRAVDHQALVGVMAERAGVRVPRVERVIKADDGTALLVMEQVDGQSLGQLPAERISDDLLRQLWAEVDSLHRAGIAHRSLRAANVMTEDGERPWLTDFSFSELAATPRQINLDLAELLAIAAAVGAFYFVLPQLAQVGSSWHALQSAHWAWLPFIIASSAVTYLASAAALIGAVPGRVPLWPATLTQAASSFVNRISPANIGGMALNARFLQKNGVSPSAGVAAVGVNALMGAVAHLLLLVIFFVLAGHRLTQAFRLPPASKLLLALALVAALAGLVLASRRGRRFAVTRLWPGVRSAAASLRTVAASPVKLTLLTGGSALITLAYIGGLVASVQAFGGHAGIAEIGAVYLGAAVIAAASPTPGGLGAIEAALVAGLTGIGVPPGPAVSAVLAYRLATYWLPVLPGWLCLRFLQNRQYI